MIIPLEVSDQLKPGADLLRSVSFAGQCRAIVEGDGKTIRLQDERLCASGKSLKNMRAIRGLK